MVGELMLNEKSSHFQTPPVDMVPVTWVHPPDHPISSLKKSTYKCGKSRKCICKTKTCTKCPRNTYSKGGTNPACTKCPSDRPYTAINSDQTSIDSCTKFKKDVMSSIKDFKIHFISSVSMQGIQELKDILWQKLN